MRASQVRGGGWFADVAELDTVVSTANSVNRARGIARHSPVNVRCRWSWRSRSASAASVGFPGSAVGLGDGVRREHPTCVGFAAHRMSFALSQAVGNVSRASKP